MEFQFTPVVRRATPNPQNQKGATPCFNSRPSCDGRRARERHKPGRRCFNSRPSCDGRLIVIERGIQHDCFNSRPSCDGRLRPDFIIFDDLQFQFTPVVRRATRSGLRLCSRFSGFNSRPSCDGRHVASAYKAVSAMFQFTPVVRRATNRSAGRSTTSRFNSRPSCDGRLNRAFERILAAVSIHARRATGDFNLSK